MRKPKVCKDKTCNMVFFAIPANAKFMDDGSSLSGWHWQCACETTHFEPLYELGKAPADKEAA